MLDVGGVLTPQVLLAIRPEDLTRQEPTRATVHQTLSPEMSGWVDSFGEGLPSLTISGNTGWRFTEGTKLDGEGSFMALNQLVQHDYSAARQKFIDGGLDPSAVKLIFIDSLDNFAWSVVPTQFTLRRSKSRPLLFQYNIALQAISTNVDFQPIKIPNLGNASNGLFALRNSIAVIDDLTPMLPEWVGAAIKGQTSFLGDIAATVANFATMANNVFKKVQSTIAGAKNVVVGLTNEAIGIAKQIASVGVNIFRTISSITNIPEFLKANLIAVTAAFNEVLCIFANSLRQRKVYEQYTGLYGASNCSSTVGGNPPSPYANQNVFNQIAPVPSVVGLGTTASASMSAIQNADAVLSPMNLAEMNRHAFNIVKGVSL